VADEALEVLADVLVLAQLGVGGEDENVGRSLAGLGIVERLRVVLNIPLAGTSRRKACQRRSILVLRMG